MLQGQGANSSCGTGPKPPEAQWVLRRIEQYIAEQTDSQLDLVYGFKRCTWNAAMLRIPAPKLLEAQERGPQATEHVVNLVRSALDQQNSAGAGATSSGAGPAPATGAKRRQEHQDASQACEMQQLEQVPPAQVVAKDAPAKPPDAVGHGPMPPAQIKAPPVTQGAPCQLGPPAPIASPKAAPKQQHGPAGPAKAPPTEHRCTLRTPPTKCPPCQDW